MSATWKVSRPVYDANLPLVFFSLFGVFLRLLSPSSPFLSSFLERWYVLAKTTRLTVFLHRGRRVVVRRGSQEKNGFVEKQRRSSGGFSSKGIARSRGKRAEFSDFFSRDPRRV